jgi:DNA repair exonuclease SbcCD ATPase subunit
MRVTSLELDGFRGYVGYQSVEFDGRSVLVFAPNGYGKSSLTDALEFLFSANGTLERLGERDFHTSSGRLPLRNTSRDADRPATVTLRWNAGGLVQSATREVRTDGNMPPVELAPLMAKRVVPFVVRGHDLRSDVEKTTPAQRYQAVAEYLGAARLAALQADLRKLKTKLTRDDDTVQRRRELEVRIGQRAGVALDLGDEAAVIAWLTGLLASVGLPAPVAPTCEDAALRLLGDRAAEERAKRGGQSLAQAQDILTNLLAIDEGGAARALHPHQLAKDAAALYARRAAETADSRRHALLAPAIAVLERDDTIACPVCDTALPATPYGDRLRLAEHLRELQQQLANVATAKDNADRAYAASRTNRDATTQQIRTVGVLASIDVEDLANSWAAAFDIAEGGNLVPFGAITDRLVAVQAGLEARRAALDAQGPPLYQRPFEQAEAVIDAIVQRRAVETRAAELTTIQAEVDQVRSMVNTAVHRFLHSNVAALSSDTATIYNRIQQDAAVPVSIDLRLTDPDAADTRGVEMVLTFPGAGETKPQGYLSDSQLNTLALAFRIAVIRRFNADFPFVALDDVLTSHDAEFRDQAAETIVTELSDLQILILTHDEMFARLLEDKSINRGIQSRWLFLRIAEFDLERGPRFLAQITAEESITAAWGRGDRAAGTMRSYVEEWLEKTCRAMGARFVMRKPTRPYNYNHWELATTLQQALKEKYNSDTVMSGVPEFNATITEVVNAVIENEGAHNHDNPYGGSDVAMERRFFGRFKRLQQYFRCGACGGKLTYRENSRRAACAKDNCGLAFSLRAEPWAGV